MAEDNSSMNGSGPFVEEEFLEKYLGPRRAQGLPETVLLTVIYCIILITGIIGNVCTCIVIYRNQYMRTATNYYLFSLAISDVLTLILGKYMYTKFLCPECVNLESCVWKTAPWLQEGLKLMICGGFFVAHNLKHQRQKVLRYTLTLTK